jgi:hypothetical protein
MRGGVRSLRIDVNEEAEHIRREAEQLELRVIAIEEAFAARWPRSIVVRARLGRQLRASVRDMQGDSFTERRADTASILVTLPGWAVTR